MVFNATNGGQIHGDVEDEIVHEIELDFAHIVIHCKNFTYTKAESP